MFTVSLSSYEIVQYRVRSLLIGMIIAAVGMYIVFVVLTGVTRPDLVARYWWLVMADIPLLNLVTSYHAGIALYACLYLLVELAVRLIRGREWSEAHVSMSGWILMPVHLGVTAAFILAYRTELPSAIATMLLSAFTGAVSVMLAALIQYQLALWRLRKHQVLLLMQQIR